MPNSPKILTQLLKILEDAHAIDLKVIDVKEQTTITDYMIICSGRASRHVRAIAEQVIEGMKKMSGVHALSATGLELGDWALIDFGDVIIHVMLPDSRVFYNLEGLWEEHN